jgi:type II secretory pathway pseudopilin PulG
MTRAVCAGSSVRSRRVGALGGFTLLETMLAMTITLVGIMAVIQAQRSFLFNNQWSSHAASANYLASEIREMTRSFPRHDRFSGGIYLTTPGDPDSLAGWGPETNEVLVPDIDDLDDLDGAVFGNATVFPEGFTMTRRYPGPINAFGEVITETLWDGSEETVQVDGEAIAVSMRGWTQIVTVEKVNPWDYSITLDDNYYETGVRDVDEYPLRVTVTVLYEGTWTLEAPAITEVCWIVPP